MNRTLTTLTDKILAITGEMQNGTDTALLALDAAQPRILHRLASRYEEQIARLRADYYAAADADNPTGQDGAFFELLSLARTMQREMEDESRRQTAAHQARVRALRARG